MKFTMFKFKHNNFPFQESTLKKTWKLFSKKDEDITLFNWTKISSNSYHIVFHISDEYFSGTQKGGEKLKLPFSQYFNTFLINDVLYIETTNKNYLEVIKDFIENEYKIEPLPLKLENKVFTNVIRKTDSYVKKLEYINNQGEEFNDESPTLNSIHNISDENYIEFINFLSGNTFISLRREGVLSINTKDEDELLNIIEVLTNEIG